MSSLLRTSDDMKYTKRNFLRKIATLFDPLGLLAPFTIRAKILLQEKWTAGLEWDGEMNIPLINSAQSWFRELHDLKQVQVPRCLQTVGKTIDSVSLHTFVDASEDAYGAVVYARYTYLDGTISTNIVAAKTRVSPSKPISVPRLELMGAVIGVRISTRISEVLELQMIQSVFWSDSLNVLWWIRGRSRNFKPFVANRVGEIQTNSNPDQWRYVPTNFNPADILSRGIKAAWLANCKRWWRGREFLRQAEDYWSTNNLHNKSSGDKELKRPHRVRNENLKAENKSDYSPECVFVVTVNNEINLPWIRSNIQVGYG